MPYTGSIGSRRDKSEPESSEGLKSESMELSETSTCTTADDRAVDARVTRLGTWRET